MIYAYNASNIAGHTKKVTVNALTLFTFSVGNIVGTQVFLSKDAPEYIPGKIVIMVMFTAQIFLSLLLRRVNIRMNIQKVAGLKVLAEQNGWDEQRILREREKHAFLDLTDKQ
jgi:MFS transporter, ACS family, allantoate permease